MVVGGRPHTQVFVLWTDIRPRFFSYFSKVDFSPDVRAASGRPARPFFSPFFLPCFPLCPIFFHFSVKFCLLGHFFQRFVGHPWVDLDLDRKGRARARRARVFMKTPFRLTQLDISGGQNFPFFRPILEGVVPFLRSDFWQCIPRASVIQKPCFSR